MANDRVVAQAGGFADEDTVSFTERFHRRLNFGDENLEDGGWIDDDDEVVNNESKIIELASWVNDTNRIMTRG